MNLKLWIEASRPKTLPLTLACIFIGNALAFWTEKFNLTVFFLCVSTTAGFQILSNFANDYGDFIKGTDDKNRIGPRRVTSSGLISTKDMKFALFVIIIFCIISSALLLFFSNLNIKEFFIFALLAFSSIIAAITYTIGKYAYGYYGLGDIFVYIFFGIIAVCGSYYLNTHEFFLGLLLPASANGFLCMAVLNINNMRDYKNDFEKKKNTIIVKFGMEFGKIYHTILLISAIIFYTIFCIIYVKNIFSFLFLIGIFLISNHLKTIWKIKNHIDFYPLLGQLSKLVLIINLLFCIGIILSKFY